LSRCPFWDRLAPAADRGWMTGYPEVILPVHGQGIRLFIRRSGVDVNLVKIVGQAVRQVGQVPRVAEHLAIGM